MAHDVPTIDDRYRGAVPMLSVRDAAAAIDFYRRAYGAEEIFRLVDAEGKVAHAEVTIGDALVMLSDPHPEESRPPDTLGGTPILIHLVVADVDAFAVRATEAGATMIRPLTDQFHGMRNCKLRDPFGHIWLVQTQTERLTPEEIVRRFEELIGGEAAGA
jgi:PhnB protein